MLTYTDAITRTGYTVIDGKRIMQHRMEIQADAPENMTVHSTKMDAEAYKANREACRQDIAEFEDAAYTLQEQYIAKKAQEVAE